MKTVKQLRDEIRLQIWPSGEAENLVNQHDLNFQEAFAEIAMWVDGERAQNCDVIHSCRTFFKCGMTIVDAPRGTVKRVYTVANADYCDPVFYASKTWPETECWSRNVFVATNPDVNVPRLPLGFRPFDASTDSTWGRARTGIFSIYNKNLYLAPWIQSNEYVVIEWEGIKETWADEDLVNTSQAYKKAVKLYVQYAHERDYGEAGKANAIHNVSKTGTFDEALADLMWIDREQRKRPETVECAEERFRFPREKMDDAIPDPITGLVVAHLGRMAPGEATGAVVVTGGAGNTLTMNVVNHGSTDFNCNRLSFVNGVGGPSVGSGIIVAGASGQAFFVSVGSPANAWQVLLDGVTVIASGSNVNNFTTVTYTITTDDTELVAMSTFVLALGPDNIVATDLISAATLFDTYDETVGKQFHSFLFPYSGAFGSGQADGRNKFWPVLAASDWTLDATLANYLAFFDLPSPQRYYEKWLGPVHFFFVDSDAAEPDGITDTSVQGAWLKERLTVSSAIWKIVVMYRNPYSSTTAVAGLRWPFKNWGADLVLSSGTKNYERLLEQNFPYIVNGLAVAKPFENVVSAAAGSKFFYNAGHAIGKLTVSQTKLIYELMDFTSHVIDSLTLSK